MIKFSRVSVGRKLRRHKKAAIAGGFRVFFAIQYFQTDRDPSSACGFG
jgi:hypothetical protein